MAKELDVYRDWLGITETVRPLNPYQLLRLKPLEDSTPRIREHYRKMTAHVRKFAAGEFARQAQDLLGELVRAMLCLTDVRGKREVDAALGRKPAAEAATLRSFEEILLAAKVVDAAQLEKARSYAKAVGLEVRDALVQQKAATPDVVTQAFAESVGLPYVDMAEVVLDESLLPRIPAAVARQNSAVPLLADAGHVLMAATKPLTPELEEDLQARFDMPVRTVLCTVGNINAVIAQHYAKDAEPLAAAAKGAGKKGVSLPKFSLPSFSLPGLALGGGGGGDVKTSGMYALIAFNMTVMVLGFGQYFLHNGGWTGRAAFVAILLSVVLGSAAAATTFVVSSRR
jgi:hypothetical protein